MLRSGDLSVWECELDADVTADRSFDMLGSFCVGKINYVRNGGGNAFMRKY